jgi:hypothetical protein
MLGGLVALTKTFLNSCEHWSEKYVEEMHNFYKLANLDYAKLANSVNWADVFRKIRGKLGIESLEILDVACGSGMFPTALQRVLSEKDKLATINYSLLDPSKFAIDETKKKLIPPFRLSKEFNTRLQDFSCVDVFHISWAIHALYAVPKNELKVSLEKFYSSFKGTGFIAHACSDAHYIKFYNLYIRDCHKGALPAFCSADDIMKIFDFLGIKYNVQYIEYINTAEYHDNLTVEAYLQRCLFDDTISLSDMRKYDLIGNYLDCCSSTGKWFFPQRVALIELKKCFV